MIPKKLYVRKIDIDIFDEEVNATRAWVANRPNTGRMEYTDLSQVWHDAKEEPKEGTKVVVIDNNGWTGSGLFNPRAMVKGVYIYGDLVVDWYSVVRWAYVNDLLPKGGEQ